MRKSKASKKSPPSKAKATKRTTSRRATTSRRRTGRATARRTRRVSPKSIPPRSTPPVSLNEIPKLIEQAVIATPPLPSKRHPIQNLLVLFLAFAATSAVGGWAVYVALFGEVRQIEAAPPPVVVEVRPAEALRIEAAAPQAQDRLAATPTEPANPPVTEVAPRPPPAAPEVTAIPAPASQPAASGPAPAPALQAPIAAKGKRRGHPEATIIAPTGPGGGAYALVAEARRYLGTNPTGRKDLWCGAFVDLVLKRLGYKGGGNLASAYARYGKRIPGPQIGAIAVMTRKGGGHVGIVSGFDSKGRPIIISGNYRRTVFESVYPGGRIYAYVIPADWDRIFASTH
jgi:uncharacterized protein (TIGR02594 family)